MVSGDQNYTHTRLIAFTGSPLKPSCAPDQKIQQALKTQNRNHVAFLAGSQMQISLFPHLKPVGRAEQSLLLFW